MNYFIKNIKISTPKSEFVMNIKFYFAHRHSFIHADRNSHKIKDRQTQFYTRTQTNTKDLRTKRKGERHTHIHADIHIEIDTPNIPTYLASRPLYAIGLYNPSID